MQILWAPLKTPNSRHRFRVACSSAKASAARGQRSKARGQRSKACEICKAGVPVIFVGMRTLQIMLWKRTFWTRHQTLLTDS